MDVPLTHDPALDLWTLHYGNVHLKAHADVVEWRIALSKALEKLGNRRVDILIDMTTFSLDPTMAAFYAPIAKAISDQHARAVVRYGKPDASTARAFQLAAAKLGYPIKIEADRDAAIRAIESIRASRSRGSRPSFPDK